MQSGKLRHRVTIQERSSARDASGGMLDVWTDKKTVWASIEPKQGTELLAAKANAGAVVAEMYLRIQLRWPGFDVTEQMRIVWNGHIYDIVDANDVRLMHFWFDISVKERV